MAVIPFLTGPRRRALLVALVAAGLLLATGLLLLRAAPGLIARRIRATARAHGLTASWRSLALRFPFGVTALGLTLTRAPGAAAVRIDSLDIGMDATSLLSLDPRPSRLAASGVAVSLGALHPSVDDTLAAEPGPGRGRLRADHLPRIRRDARQLARLLMLPPERLPTISLRDVAVRTETDAGRGRETLRLERLELTPRPGGSRLLVRGAGGFGRAVPFGAGLDYGHDGTLQGRAVIDFGGGPQDVLALTIVARIVRSASPRGLRLASGSRVVAGSIPVALAGELNPEGPHVRLAVEARDVREDGILASVPRALLGPLAAVSVRGAFDYELSLDLDLARPDSLVFDAHVIPHGLALDSVRTGLRLSGLEQPFTATIHLPGGQQATRELSFWNPHFRPLDQIDSTLALAVVTNEDGGFFRHRGFNPEAVKAALAENLHAGAYRRGAGTITMQLARNLYLGHERTLSRKAQEVVLTWVLEHLSGVSKRRLLEIYLNIIEWGPQVHGADEAAEYYFGHDAGRLSVAEALFLATVVPAPSRWRYRFDATGGLRHYAQAQMHFIGRAMIAKGWLTDDSLPPADSLQVEINGPARALLSPSAAPDSADAHSRAWRFPWFGGKKDEPAHAH